MSSLIRFIRKFFERVPIQERINFIRHLSLTTKAGLPVFEGLKIIKRQTTSKTLLRIIDQLLIAINNGKFLADSLEQYKHIFNDFSISIIRVGETSGALSANLAYLAEEMEKSKELKSKIRSALIYPIIVTMATLAIVVFLVFFVFPKIIPVFASLNVELPTATKILIAFSNFIAKNLTELSIGFALFVIVARFLVNRVQKVRFFLHRLLLFIPLASKISIGYNMANFARVLAILLKSGVAIVEAVIITSKTFENLVYRRELQKAAEEIRKGEQLSFYLVKKPKIFPPLLSGMIEIGENTGNLEENLTYLADYYAKEVDLKTKNLATTLEPLLLLFMGLVVGFVAISIITPIYKITSSVGK